MFYVYKWTGRRRTAKWEFVSQHREHDAAEKAARALAGKPPYYTEPGYGLTAAFFSEEGARQWASVITTEKLESNAT